MISTHIHIANVFNQCPFVNKITEKLFGLSLKKEQWDEPSEAKSLSQNRN